MIRESYWPTTSGGVPALTSGVRSWATVRQSDMQRPDPDALVINRKDTRSHWPDWRDSPSSPDDINAIGSNRRGDTHGSTAFKEAPTMTTDTVQDEWALSSGLALDGANAEITGFEFGYNANIGAGIVCANITFTPLEGGEDIEQSFSVGKGWDASRDGSELVPESGKNRPINKSTNFGRLIESAVACLDGDGSKLGGTPKQAGTWIGSRWEVGTVQIETTNPTTQVTKTKDAFVFVDFLGSSEGEAKAAAPTKAPAKKAATGAKTTTPTVPDGIDESLWTTLVELAGTHDEHDAFVDAALDIAEVESNKAAQKAVMGTKAGSVWAAKVAA